MLKGVYTVAVTPFRDDYSLDEEGLRENLRLQVKEGVDGIVVLGTTSESPTLTSEEEELTIKIGIEECRGKVPLWVGTGSNSTAVTIKKTEKAKAMGASGALVVTPYYNKPTQEGLFCHYRELAKATRFPLIVYNIQGRTAQNLSTDTLKRLMDLPEIVGVKEASGNILQIMDVIEAGSSANRPGFAVLSGDDSLTLPVIALGGQGIISVVSNVVPTLMVELTRLCLSGDFVQARALHRTLLPLFRAAFIETNPAPIKAMMAHVGMKAGPLRLPLVSVSHENQTQICRCLDEILTLQN